MRYLLIVFTILCGFGVLAAQEAEVPEKALCAVCAVRGETELEKVKAHATYEGDAYYFCSSGCKDEFLQDPQAYLPPKLPRPAPAFVVETLDGDDVALTDYAGQVVLLDFWATWCKPCVEIMPRLQALHDAHSARGLVVLGVSIDEEKDRRDKIEKFLRKQKITYPIAIDAKAVPAWHQFKVKAIPAMFLLDRDGQIVRQWLGRIAHDDVSAAVESLMAPKGNKQKE